MRSHKGRFAASRTAWGLLLAAVVFFGFFHAVHLTDPQHPSAYNSYTLQAMQWRQGKIALEQDVPHLELAIYQGQYYVSFPPVPTLPVYLLTFVFGDRVPDGLLVKLYGLLSLFFIYRVLAKRYGDTLRIALLSFLLCLGSALLPLMTSGAVWYQAQALGLMLTLWSIDLMLRNKPNAALFVFALSVGCRPFNALFGVWLLLWYFMVKRGAVKWVIPGLLMGLSVAVLYGLYNYMRFGDILEFGHSYLPEFQRAGQTQFALQHIGENAKTFILGFPWRLEAGRWQMNTFGFSLFLSNPPLLLALYWGVRDAAKRRMTPLQGITMLLLALHGLLLLSHRTAGGFQFGARYWIDCLPYALLYLCAQGSKTGDDLLLPQPFPPGNIQMAILLAGLLLNAYGACVMAL